MTSATTATAPGLRAQITDWLGLAKEAAVAWSDDYAPSMGAALSYYSVFSMAPLLMIVISIAGLIFGEEAARGEVFGQLNGLMGADAAAAVEEMLQSLSKPESGLTAAAISIAALLLGATTVFGELQDALDRIWRAPARVRSSGLWSLLRSRLLSFGMVLGIAFLLMVSLVLSAATSALGKWWGGFFGEWEVLLQAVNIVVGFALTTGVFALIYKLMPRVSVQWRDVWVGAAITSLLFTIGRFLIGLYIGKSGVASGFGAAGSIAIVFVWVYYSSQIFLFGAEFTWVHAKRRGHVDAGVATADPAKGGALPVPAKSGALSHDRRNATGRPIAGEGRPVRPVRRLSTREAAVAAGVQAIVQWVLPAVIRRWRRARALRS